MKWILGMTLFWVTTAVFGFDYMIQCQEPIGIRMDYYLTNKAGFENNKFLYNSDKISKAHPLLFFSKNKALFILPDTFVLGFNTRVHYEILHYFYVDEDQMSLYGFVNGAPLLVSYFPKMHLMYYTVHRNILFPGYAANAQLFSSTCFPPLSKKQVNEVLFQYLPSDQRNTLLQKLNAF